MGSEFGGTYDNFYMAMWDPKGLMFKWVRHHVFIDLTFFCQGISSCFCPYWRATTLVQVNYTLILKTNVTELASQLKWNLLRGPHPVGSSTSPGCGLPASAWVRPGTDGRGELECVQPQQAISFMLLPKLHIFTELRCQKKFRRQLEI